MAADSSGAAACILNSLHIEQLTSKPYLQYVTPRREIAMNRIFLFIGISLVCVLGASEYAAPQTSTPPVAKSPEPLNCSEPGPWSVAVAADAVYWTNFGAGTVVKAPLAGGMATIIASGQRGPCAIATDGNNLYWTNNLDGTVMKMPAKGGPPSVLASKQRQPSAIGVLSGTVIWMTAAGPRIADLSTGATVHALDDSNAGGGTNPGTVKCHVCPDYCTRFDAKGKLERYICGWHSCPPCGA